jgi:hypothetical protein
MQRGLFKKPSEKVEWNSKTFIQHKRRQGKMEEFLKRQYVKNSKIIELNKILLIL